MIIKKFEAETEKEAILKAKDELGTGAIVLNIRTVKPKGFYRFFHKTTVEVTAAIDDEKKKASQKVLKGTEEKTSSQYHEKKVSENETAIEQKLNSLQELIEKQMSQSAKTETEEINNMAEKEVVKKELSKNDEYLLLVQKQLVDNEVEEGYAEQILDEISCSLQKDSSVDHILTNVYQKLVLKLGETKQIDVGNKKFVFFIGPTGVGKTTTIAKIASHLKLVDKVNVALITSDTYRIAAVEQLRTYASILGIPLSVVYSKEELEGEKEKYKDYDIVLIDTAGRSHRNEEQREDLLNLIETVDKNERDVFLVLSATTKYKDLIRITETYSIIEDFGLIFTKLDETTCIGNILNIKLRTDAPLSYITWGQNVPDDFGCMDAQNIAKKLLGGNR